MKRTKETMLLLLCFVAVFIFQGCGGEDPISIDKKIKAGIAALKDKDFSVRKDCPTHKFGRFYYISTYVISNFMLLPINLA